MNNLRDDDAVKDERDDAIVGQVLKVSGIVALILAAVVILFVVLQKHGKHEEKKIVRNQIQAPGELNFQAEERPRVVFREYESGIEFVHRNGAVGEKLLPETMGGGVAVFDYDNDGDDDILFVNGTSWPHEKTNIRATQALYQNDGTGHFTDVTKESGLNRSFYGMGVAVGDADNDGDKDVFISAVGKNYFFQNRGGRFVDVTESVGLSGHDDAWSTGSGFFDYDNDGDLDLFVCNYITWNRRLDMEINFTMNGTDRAYGPPTQYRGSHSYLYRNDGGRFTDVSKQAGIQLLNPATGNPMGKGLSVTFTDVQQDGLPDIIVANDTVQNFVFINKGDGTFEDMGMISGIAFDDNGMATGSMGVDVGFFDQGKRMMLSVGNFANESTALYVQGLSKSLMFSDMANQMGIGSPSRLRLSFGVFFFDYDLDGREDILQSNGHLEEEIHSVQAGQHYRQAPQLFWNRGERPVGQYVLVPEEQTGALANPIVGRGASYGDFDNDGDLDVVLTQVKGKPLVLLNDQKLSHHWIRIKLIGTRSNRDAIGAYVTVNAGGLLQKKQVMPTRSYLSQVPTALTFGLGKNETISSIRVQWPGGTEIQYSTDKIDQTIIFKQYQKQYLK
jgi:enediyne biosynthesis protein E4